MGIGFACARALCDLGATVHVTSTTDRISERAAELGGWSIGVVADLTIEAHVDALHAALGDVDVVVNRAGMVSVGSPDLLAPVTSMSYDDWRADLARNLARGPLTAATRPRAGRSPARRTTRP